MHDCIHVWEMFDNFAVLQSGHPVYAEPILSVLRLSVCT